MILYTLLPGLSASARDWSLLSSLTLIPTTAPPALSVAWTLTHEMLFYGVFLTFYVTRAFAPIIAVWAALIVIGGWIMGAGGIVLAPINLDSSPACSRRRGPVPAVAFGVRAPGPRVLGSAASLLWLGSGGHMRVWFRAVARARAAGPRPDGGTGRLTAPPWLMLLGNSSYAIYLVHNPWLRWVRGSWRGSRR